MGGGLGGGSRIRSRRAPFPDAPFLARAPPLALAPLDLARLALVPPTAALAPLAAVPVLAATSPPSHPAGRCRLRGRPGGYRSRPAGGRVYGHSAVRSPTAATCRWDRSVPASRLVRLSSLIVPPLPSHTLRSDGTAFLPLALHPTPL